MRNKIILFLAAISAAGILFNACKHEIPVLPGSDPTGGGGGNQQPPPAYSCSPDTVYFANTISPLIASGCAKTGCHDAATHAEGVVLTNYNRIMNYVVPGNASNSKLYKEIIKTGSERMPPPPNPAFTASQIAAVQQWINQGAKNNACTDCDTTDFRYSTAIKTIIQNKCVGCHNPSSLGGGIDLSTYTGVNTVAHNGKLYGSVSWSAGYSAMPKNSYKLPDCEIKQIKKWIDSGAPNN